MQVSPASPNSAWLARKAKKETPLAEMNLNEVPEELWQEFLESSLRLENEASILRGLLKGLRGSREQQAEEVAPAAVGVPRWAQPSPVACQAADESGSLQAAPKLGASREEQRGTGGCEAQAAKAGELGWQMAFQNSTDKQTLPQDEASAAAPEEVSFEADLKDPASFAASILGTSLSRLTMQASPQRCRAAGLVSIDLSA